MSVLEWVLLAVLATLAIMAALVAWSRPIQRALIRLAAARVAKPHSDRVREEWYRELQEMPHWNRLSCVFSLVLRRTKVARSLHVDPAKSFGFADVVTRAMFFATTLLQIVLDGVYLVSVYLWTRVVGHFAGAFEDVTGYEHWLLTVTKMVLTIVPSVVVIWYVLVDFVGTLRRIWERRIR